MDRPDTITMSMQELDRCKVIEAVVRDGLMVWRIAEKLSLLRRQIERFAVRYRAAISTRIGRYTTMRTYGASFAGANGARSPIA